MLEDTTVISPGMIQLVTILVGFLVLAVGRKLFWVFVGAVGFVVGLFLSAELLGGQPDWVLLVIALLAGVVGAVLAVLLQKVAVVIAGFIAGGYALLWLLQAFPFDPGQLFVWLLFIIGGIIGAILATFLFAVALIALSVVVGATLIVQAFNFGPMISALLFVVLLVVGLVVQTQVWQQDTSGF